MIYCSRINSGIDSSSGGSNSGTITGSSNGCSKYGTIVYPSVSCLAD